MRGTVLNGCLALVNNLKISLSNVAVRGVALLANELYVLRVGGKSSDVAVYETRIFSLQCRLTVPWTAGGGVKHGGVRGGRVCLHR